MKDVDVKELVHHELISLSDRGKWQEALQGISHAFGHTWESCYAMQLTTGCPTYLYVCQAGDIRIVCPLVERKFKGYTDIVTPYGFSGFVGNNDLPGFPEQWQKFILKAGYVCGYIGLNPLLVRESYLTPSDIHRYNTVYILNLELSMSQLFQNLSYNRKRQLKLSKQNAHKFSTDKNTLEEFFVSNYHNFVSHKKAGQTYHFSIETLKYIISLDCIILIGFIEDSRVKAVSMFAYTPYVGEYLFNISLPGAQDQTTPLLWYGVEELKNKNIPYLNLGGGAKERDSIDLFKQRFGASPMPLRCLKQIYNMEYYEKICTEVGKNAYDKIGYFPAYRSINTA